MRQKDITKIIGTIFGSALIGTAVGCLACHFVNQTRLFWFAPTNVSKSDLLSGLLFYVLDGLLLGGYVGWQLALWEIRQEKKREKAQAERHRAEQDTDS